jgi:hypothetical protein
VGGLFCCVVVVVLFRGDDGDGGVVDKTSNE